MRLLNLSRTLVPLALAAVLGGSRLVAQAPAPNEMGRISWSLGAASSGWCVHFLSEPKEAAKEVTGGRRVVPASAAEGIHPALKRAIADEPNYAEWVPSELCTYTLASVQVGEKLYERGDKGVPLTITFWGVAVSDGEGAWDGQVFLKAAGSNSYPLARAMQVQRLPMEKISVDLKPIQGNDEDHIYITKFNKATIQFTGHFNPDTTGAAVAERKIVGLLPGPIQSEWTSTITYQPEKIGTMAGSMQVFGSRGLAKLLNKSPIRLIGPAFTGGSGTALYVRTSTNKK
jgi:hypothetical protein